MITIYAPSETDFSGLGLCALTPGECEIEEQAGGMYELRMTHPMDDAARWTMIARGCVLRAPAPVRETPLVEIGHATTAVTRQIYSVHVNSRLHLRTKPSTSTGRIIGRYRNGTRVAKIGQSGSWFQVIVCSGGATGWMHSDYLRYVGTETETIVGDKPGETIQPRQTRDQLFRIVSVDRDDTDRTVSVTAQHISYDLKGNPVKDTYEPKDVAANAVVEALLSKVLNNHEFSVYCTATGNVSGDYTRLSVIESLLDPEQGVVAQSKARLVRDNFDIFVLEDETRNLGVEIRHGKNLVGATLTEDASSLVTRIIPVGKNANGDPLLLSGTIYVDSPNIGNYPVIYAKAIEYDVQTGKDGIANDTQARTKLAELAAADFADNGVDLPSVGLEVDFLALEQTAEYSAYADLQYVHLYDTVHVIAHDAGIDAIVRMTGYKYDALHEMYTEVTLGDLQELKTTVYGYDIAGSSVGGSKLIKNTVDGAKLRNVSVPYGKFDTAAITQLAADAITATTARIVQIVADQATTDELYAAIADIITLTVQQITAATVSTDQLYAALAQVIELRVQQITAATISTDQLYAALADVIVLRAQQAALASVEADNLTAAIATISDARIDSADIGFAQIKDLVTGTAIIAQGVGGKYYIANLAVTEANMVSLSVGELMVKGADGRLYRLGVDEAGQITNTPIQIEGADVAGNTLTGDKMIENTITARELNVQNIFADNAMIRELIAANLDVGTLFAREATVAALNAADISGNASLNLYVKQADLSTYLRLTTGQVELGETDSPVRVQLRTGENAGLYIVEGAQANAYFGQNKARIERLEMGEAIIIGNTAIVAQNNGDDVYWLGR